MKKGLLIELIADFSAPIGPEVFAGLGSGLQNSRASWNDDAGEYLANTDAFVRDWAEKADFEETLAALVDILKEPPGRKFHNNFCERLKDDWAHGLSTFATALARRNPARFAEELNLLMNDPELAGTVSEILDGIEEDRARDGRIDRGAAEGS
ncbi:MAG: hypothetical protein AB2L14_36960 [Candidatus Xenobiia bacterium LiM19]